MGKVVGMEQFIADLYALLGVPVPEDVPIVLQPSGDQLATLKTRDAVIARVREHDRLVAERAWIEGAEHAWQNTGEGFNGEYPGERLDLAPEGTVRKGWETVYFPTRDPEMGDTWTSPYSA